MPPRKRASARPPEPPKDNESANRKRKIEEVTVISSEEDESAVKAETEQKTAKPRVRRRRVETDDDGYESSSSSNSELDEDIEFEEDKNVDVKNESDDLVENSELASTTPKKAGTKTPVKRTPPSRNASERAAAGLRRTMEVLAALGAESTTSEEDAPAPVSKTKAAASAAKGKTAPSKAQTAQPKPPKEPKAPQKRSAASASARKSAPPAPKSTKKPASDSSSESDFALKRETGGSSSSSSTSSSGSESDTGSSLSSTEEPALNPDAPRRRPRAPVDPVERQKKLEQARKKRESTIKLKVEKHHPELQQVWNSVDLTTNYDRAKKPTQEGIEQPAELVLRLLPFQLEGVGWMRRQEDSEFGGGILADEMGLGKTIQTIGLLLTQPRLAPNLVLTPTVALLQWQEEIIRHTLPGTLNILVYHGTERPTTVAELESYDVILSTYSIVESGYRKQQYGFKRKGQVVKETSVLHQIDWKRVILDEAHSIKDRSCSTARAVFALKCEKKWCLSGTPLQNRVGELYSLLRFLRVDPFSYYFCTSCECKSLSWSFSDRRNCDDCGHKPMAHFCWWNREILKPIQNYGGEHEDGRVAFRKLAHLLDKIMLRRTKVERADDLGLPPRVVVVRRDYFNEEEDDLYNSLYGDAKRKFDTYVAEDRVLNNYANIFELLMRMRQAANHPDLVTKKSKLAENQKVDTLVCGICQEPAEDAIVSKCKHTFCREDIQQYINSSLDPSPKCPVCFRTLNIDLSQPEIQPSDSTDVDKKMRASIINYLDMSRWRSSSKIEALVEELTNLRSKDCTIKSLVFSQFVNFLDLVHWRLQRSGFTCVKLDGRMSPQQRANIINAFNTDPKITVFLISLKAGGIALNLTEASTVFMMDPWWNPATEDQAMDRIHRLGQKRPIKITRLIIENSIESRILQLQQKKKLLFESTIGKDMDALAKLTEDDLKFLFVL